MCCERSSMRSSLPRTWIRSPGIGLRGQRRLAKSRREPKHSEVDGPLWQDWQKGLYLLLCATHLLETNGKRGHVVCGYVAVGNGESGGSLLDCEAMSGDVIEPGCSTWRGKMRACSD